VWRVKSSQADQVACNHMKQEVMAVLKGETNENFMEWLSNSVICESNEPWDLEALFQALVKDGCAKIRALTKVKFILTYHTSEQKEEALRNNEELGNWFHEVKNWDIYEVVNQGHCGLKCLVSHRMVGPCRILKK